MAEPRHNKGFWSKGFTLAEVLITLGIIGVVAALTIPTLVQKYDERATVVKVKQFYSDFSEAYKLAVIENGTIDTWGLPDSETIEDEDGNVNHTQESYANYDKFYNIMSTYMRNLKYEKLKTDPEHPDTTTGGYILPNGIAIRTVWLQTSKCDIQNCGDLYIVTDGGPMDEYSNGKRKPRKYLFYIKKRLY